MLVLVVKLFVKEGKKEEFIRIAKPLIEASQKEEGNIEYNLYENLDEQNGLAFIEKWKDQDALAFHEKQPHFIQNIRKIGALCTQPAAVSRFDIAN